MKREHLAFLAAGLAFGVLIGLAIGQFAEPPEAVASSAVPAPAGPAAPTQTGGTAAGAGAGAGADSGGAPMMAEIAALRARLEDDPDDLPTLSRLANLYHDAQMWEPAKSFYERAVALAPTDPDLLTDYGVCFVGTGDFDRAMALFDRAQEARPGHPQSLFNTAVVAGLYAGDFDRAEAAVARLESIDPSQPRLEQLKADLASARAARGSSGS